MTKNTNGSGRYFVYTWNNPNISSEEHHESLRCMGVAFHTFQLERSKSGTPHFQGYIEFVRNVGFIQLKTANSQVHWERRAGTQAQATRYCNKHCTNCYEGKEEHSEDVRLEGPWTFGTATNAVTKGMSAGFLDAIKEGKRMRELLSDYPDDIRKYPRYYDAVRQVYGPPERETPPEIHLVIGPPGSGKTRWVRSIQPVSEMYIKPIDKDFWMDGYDGHKHVLIDDFQGAPNHVSLVNLLQLLDRYIQRVPCKGSHVWWYPEKIFITTNIHPARWYKYAGREVHYQALIRRFTRVWEHTLEPPLEIYPELWQHSVEPQCGEPENLWDLFWDFDTHKSEDDMESAPFFHQKTH